MTNCRTVGGCVSDYVAAGITFFVIFLVCIGICFVSIKRRQLELNAKKVSVLLVQAFASLIYLVSSLMSLNYLRLSRRHLWQNCDLMLWLKGPFGFGILLSCHIVQAYRLHYVFIARRLPPLKYYQLLPLLVSPWFAVAAVIQAVSDHDKRSPTCQFNIRWELAVGSLYALYPAILLLATWKVRHIRFEFDEFKELLKAASICALMLVVWAGMFVAAQLDSKVVVTTRFIVAVSVGVLFLFWIPIAKPVHDLFHGRRSNHRYSTMGQALGVPVSGAISQPLIAFNFNRPLELLLEHRRFRQSYLAFADSRMAGEVVHFYSEVRELNKLQQQHQVVQRIYMAEHIIDKYIKSGAPMEINISHQMRLDIINTTDLADPDLFKRAVGEVLKMMQMNLSNDYWQSEYFQELKDELDADVESQQTGDDLEQQLDVTATKRALRRLYDPTPDNPFDQGCPFSGELRKENQPEQHHTGESQSQRSEILLTSQDTTLPRS
ncbi:hypothetical protein SELMODRAFT_156749 [Selaginella moellendorffii]|uniref:RGS domain-containing protein n=1 Tax=Selaginella moellendorffii TaxID=88036 RepID=D8SMS6_SELML|nr:hypothetical protein SELMODRAFT_156749 [Selaginella moellendorffii]